MVSVDTLVSAKIEKSPATTYRLARSRVERYPLYAHVSRSRAAIFTSSYKSFCLSFSPSLFHDGLSP